MSERPYSRVYWEVMEDEKFDGIREDPRVFGTWSLMLVVADMAWPVPAFIPPTVPRKAVALLAARGLVDLQTGGRYRIHGLDKERNARSDRARTSATRRYDQPANALQPQSSRTATAEQPQSERTATALLAENETSTSRDETRQTREEGWDQPEIEALQWLARHGCALSETNGLRRKLIGHVERSGINAVVGALDRLVEAGVADGDARRFVFGLDDLLFPKPDLKALEREERAEVAASNFDRGVERTQRMLREMRGESA